MLFLWPGCQDDQRVADHVGFQHGRDEGSGAGGARGSGLPVGQRSHDTPAAVHRHRALGLRLQPPLLGGQKQESELAPMYL